MRIIVRDSDGTNLNIPIPNILLSKVLSGKINNKYISNINLMGDGTNSDRNPEFINEAVKILLATAKEQKKLYGEFVLVEVNSADGDYVKITI